MQGCQHFDQEETLEQQKKTVTSPFKVEPADLEQHQSLRSNLRVAQNGRFVMNPIFPRDDTTVVKILDFRLSESLKMRSPGPFALPHYP